MRFALSEEQLRFAESLHELLSGMDTPAVVRAWSAGQPEPGRKLWRRLGDLGVPALLVPERFGGLDATAVDLVVAFEVLGYHAVPGPIVESAAVAPRLLDDDRLAQVATGELLVTVAAPLALDADVAMLLGDGSVGERVHSVDAARRLFRVTGSPAVPERAHDLGVLAVSAQLVGLGRWLLDASVAHAGQRSQYGRVIGQFQAVKHLLADVATQLELAGPLVHGAAVTLSARDVSAAKVAAGDAAYLAARAALQVHGAVGYTAEHDLGLWFTKVRALVGAWGGATQHRRRILGSLP
jgi:alkylation response protein AidB-like acyl-CoA dehydrogenase